MHKLFDNIFAISLCICPSLRCSLLRATRMVKRQFHQFAVSLILSNAVTTLALIPTFFINHYIIARKFVTVNAKFRLFSRRTGISKSFCSGISGKFIAHSTISPLSILYPNRVFRRKFVTAFAKFLLGVQRGRATTAKAIHLFRNGFQMSRIDARRIAAKMVTVETLWDNFYKQLIHHTISRLRLSFISDVAISFVEARRPFPAGNIFVKTRCAYFDFREKTNKKIAINRQSTRMRLSHTVQVPFEWFRLGSKSVDSTFSSRFYFS